MLRIALTLLALASPSAVLACSVVGGGESGLDALNGLRANAGAQALALSPAMTQVAQQFACDMADRGYFSHTTPEGRGFQTRLRAAGLPGGCGAENIAYTGASGGAGQALNQWTGSPPHRRNMLSKRYAWAGFAGAQGGGKTYWVLLLGKCR